MEKYICRIEDIGNYLYCKDNNKILKYVSLGEMLQDYKSDEIVFVKNTETINSFSFPFKIFLDISNYCNLHCKHCLSQSSPKHIQFLDMSIIKKIVDEICKYGVFQIKIGGGEPLLYPHFWDIISYIRNNMPLTRISFTTNGTTLSIEDIQFIKKYKCEVSVSIDGTEEIHNCIRNGDVYKKAYRTIELLLENNITPIVRYTLMDQNIECFREVYDLFKNQKITLKVRRYKCTSHIQDKLLTYKEDYFELIKKMNNNLYCDLEDIMKNKLASKEELYCSYDCGAAFRSIYIDCFGNISPCVFMGDEFLCGNVMENKIKKIWDTSGILKKIRMREDDSKCSNCERRLICHGECLGIRKYYKSNSNIVDPACMIGR